MLQEKPTIENLIIKIAQQNKFNLHRHPHRHAGGKMVFTYQSLLNHKGRLEIDMNYIFRIPLFGCDYKSTLEWPAKISNIPILDIHELAVGKLHALLGRTASRDLFDSYQLLTTANFDLEKLRLAFTVYAGMETDNWEKINAEKINIDVNDILTKLIPVLRSSAITNTSQKTIQNWALNLITECKKRLRLVLPFRDNEIMFLERLQKDGKLIPTLITKDKEICDKIEKHPSLIWRIKQRQAEHHLND